MRRQPKAHRNIVYLCTDHVVWCPKYRRPVLRGAVREHREQIIREVARERRAEVLEVKVMPDHVHLLVDGDPQYGIHRPIKRIKGRSSHVLRATVPPVRSRLPPPVDEQLLRRHGGRCAAGDGRSPSSSSAMSNSEAAPKAHTRRRTRTPSFICELPLRASPAWARPRALPRDTDKQRARRARAFARARKRYGLTEHALQRVALTHFRRSGWMCSHLGTHEVQKIGTRAYLAVTRILLDHSRSARFKGPGQFHSLEGKSNATGIRWRGDHVHWRGLALPAIIKRGDPVAEHALTTRVKYVRIVLRRVRGVPRVYAQLVCQGHPYRKPKNRIGCG